MQAILASHYMPCLAYFICLGKAETAFIEAHEAFQKQTYRNRAYINTANGIDRLTVPVVQANSKTPIQATAIDYKEAWENRHWRAIRSAYAQAPYFEYYADAFMPAMYAKHEYLFQLNEVLTNNALKMLGWASQLPLTQQFVHQYEESTHLDLRERLGPKKPFTVKMPPYYQVFGSNFAPNMSILDLLFCTGPDASAILRQSEVVWGS